MNTQSLSINFSVSFNVHGNLSHIMKLLSFQKCFILCYIDMHTHTYIFRVYPFGILFSTLRLIKLLSTEEQKCFVHYLMLPTVMV